MQKTASFHQFSQKTSENDDFVAETEKKQAFDGLEKWSLALLQQKSTSFR